MPAERIFVIDADLGQSGQDGNRPGFRELLAEVSLSHVGLILAYEASRLARNNADWYALLDLAALRGTLIAESPPAFRSRMIFTFVEPLQRARFPRDAARIRRPLGS